jgi:hypothetical protein
MNKTTLTLAIEYLLEGSTEGQLASNTKVFFGPQRKQRANRVQVANFQYVPAVGNGVLIVKADTRTNDKRYETTIQFENVVYVKPDRPYAVPLVVGNDEFHIMPIRTMKQHVKVHCTCMDFYWRFAMYNDKDDSLLGKPPAPYVKKTDREPQNPKQVPGVCKHITALADKLRLERVLR